MEYMPHNTNRRVPASALVLFSLLAPAMLGSCGGGSETNTSNSTPSTVPMTATDDYTGKTITYQTTSNFSPLTTTLEDAPLHDDERDMLASINAVRKSGGICTTTNGGTKTYKDIPPIQFEGHLHKSATTYVKWMQDHNYKFTESPEDHLADKNTPLERMLTAGYRPAKRAIFAEALEGGAPDAKELIAAWESSPSHCATLFDANLTWGSIARSESSTSNTGNGYYWVMNLASF